MRDFFGALLGSRPAQRRKALRAPDTTAREPRPTRWKPARAEPWQLQLLGDLGGREAAFEADDHRGNLIVARIGHLDPWKRIDRVQLHEARFELRKFLGLSPGFFHVDTGAHAWGDAMETRDLDFGRSEVFRIRNGNRRRAASVFSDFSAVAEPCRRRSAAATTRFRGIQPVRTGRLTRRGRRRRGRHGRQDARALSAGIALPSAK